MASAILASRNEQNWGERNVYMKKYSNNSTNNTHINTRFKPNPNPNPTHNRIYNPNINLTRQAQETVPKAHFRFSNEPPRPPAAAVNEAVLIHQRPEGPVPFKDPFNRYITFNLDSYSREDLKELKNRLISDLERVRSLLTQIGNREIGTGPGFQVLQFRPAPVDLSHHAVQPPAKVQKQNSGFAAQKGKKNKKVAGKKRGRPLASDREAKRPVIVESEEEKVVGAMMKKCKQILTKLMKHQYSWIFNKPVDVKGLGLHDYHQIIKRPMDLGTVKSKLNKKEYQMPLHFAADVRLTFENAIKYNLKGQDAHTIAEMMLLSFEDMFRPEYQKYEMKHQKVIAEKQQLNQMPMDLSRPMPLVGEPNGMRLPPKLMSSPRIEVAQVPVPSHVEKDMLVSSSESLPTPEAKDQNKRRMSFEEKYELGSNLQHIPIEKMEQLMQIVRKRNPNLMILEGNELELDFEALDNETLWDLDRFVSYQKKTVNKMRWQELISSDPSTKQVHKSPPREHFPEVPVQKNKKGDAGAGEEDVDIGEEIPANNFPPVEIEKDPAGSGGESISSGSSSSSSDDSSSSFSDSDSESYSGSDSDKGSVQSPFVEPKSTPAASIREGVQQH